MTSPADVAGNYSDIWSAHQPAFRFTSAEPGSAAFFAEIEAHRYGLEPHILEIVDFPRWRDKDVLEAGCGIGTDAIQFARSGAHYVGVDFAPDAVRWARRRFELEGRNGSFTLANILELPFEDESFDLVYSYGVIHHVADTQRAVDEFHRVLRPGGRALVMVYHRNSFNYRFTIMMLRRALAAALVLPGAIPTISALTREDPNLLREHRRLLAEHGLRYLRDKAMFLSRNTDGPANPLSKAYTESEARELFARFASVTARVRYLNLRIYPGGERLARTNLARKLERRFGWHLYVEATKAEPSGSPAQA
jgi:ubiquinone/menaquinone biosynthesis C-methylase UbiE